MFKLIVRWMLTRNNVAWVDPRCGCLRSPDVPFMSECPADEHVR